ncbi:hypothetical protein A9Q99_26855 [Gammaproteobacteria bacterium 45_16_T64]|nr:hypothetical protein A9Q99_26855 [Gammaproteobacteria bacterium 45_16_T64]
MIFAIPCTLDDDCPEHHHNLHELVVCLEPGATLMTGGKQFTFNAGETFLIQANAPHEFRYNGPNSATALIFCFDNLELSDNLPPRILPLIHNYFASKIQDPCEEKSIVHNTSDAQNNENIVNARKLQQILDSKCDLHEELASSLLSLLLLNHLVDKQPARIDRNPIQHTKIQYAIQWIDSNLSENASISDAAKEAGMSRAAFTKHFRKYTGKSFTQYITHSRVNFAAGLLAQQSTSITDIAYQSGYNNLGHFFKQFQRHYDMTPSQYRNVMSTQGHHT